MKEFTSTTGASRPPLVPRCHEDINVSTISTHNASIQRLILFFFYTKAEEMREATQYDDNHRHLHYTFLLKSLDVIYTVRAHGTQ